MSHPYWCVVEEAHSDPDCRDANGESRTYVTVLVVGERIEVYADSADAYDAERAYLDQGVKARQMRVSTERIRVTRVRGLR